MSIFLIIVILLNYHPAHCHHCSLFTFSQIESDIIPGPLSPHGPFINTLVFNLIAIIFMIIITTTIIIIILTFRQIESDIIPKPLDFCWRSRSCRSAGQRHLSNRHHDDNENDDNENDDENDNDGEYDGDYDKEGGCPFRKINEGDVGLNKDLNGRGLMVEE